MMEGKPWYKSRTIITGVVAALVGAAATIGNLVSGREVLNIETQAAIITVVAGLVMLILRSVTKEPLGGEHGDDNV